MSAIFPKSADKVLRLAVAGMVVCAGLGAGLFAYFSHPKVTDTGYSPVQPVPYSHKLHAGNLGLDCRYCHFTVERSSYAAIPPTETCMNCHSRVKPQSPLPVKVRESYASGEPIPWVKVHKLPDYVYFNHRAHGAAGVSCFSCHGRADQMLEVKQVEPLNMGWCLDCHRNPAPNLRPVGDPAEMGREIVQARHIAPPTNCSGCHR